MSLLDHPAVALPSAVRQDELEDAFVAWAHDPAKPDVVDLGQLGGLPMAELSQRLRGSRTPLAAAASAQLGLPPEVTIATAAARLRHATVDPDGPRCRSFRAASYYLRGLAHLDDDVLLITTDLGRTGDTRGDPSVE